VKQDINLQANEEVTHFMEIKKVGVVGCGQMGGGIVQVCAQSGYAVTVSEVSEELLKRGLASIEASLTRSVQKEKITQQDKEATLARIKGTTDVKDFCDCDLVIEAAIENIDLKKRVRSAPNRPFWLPTLHVFLS
jgi:3-hydroxybutyryl-CoA dehydrogenase